MYLHKFLDEYIIFKAETINRGFKSEETVILFSIYKGEFK